MYDGKELCEKIRSIYPEVGECGIEVGVEYDKIKEAWVVDLRKGEQSLSTHLEEEDAYACLEGERCLTLGSKIGQLVNNVNKV